MRVRMRAGAVVGDGDPALQPHQHRQQTGRLLPTLVRAIVVAPRDVPSLGVTESGPGGWNRGQGQRWVRVGVGVRVGVRAYSARSSEVVPRLASSSSMSEAWGQG